MGLAERIILLRKERKVTQGELAKRLEVHQNILGRYERGETTPNVDMVIKLADAFGVSLDYLVGKTDVELDKSLLDKIVTIQKLPEEDKSCIMYSLDGLIQHAKTRKAYAS